MFTETAINIGYSCRLLTDEMEEIYIVDGESYQEVEDQLRKAKQDMDRMITQRPNEMEVVSFANGMHQPLADPPPDDDVSFALVINGHSLVSSLFVLAFTYTQTWVHFLHNRKKVQIKKKLSFINKETPPKPVVTIKGPQMS